MAEGYDGFDKSLEYRQGGGGGSFVMGLLTGTVLGAGLGMLFAPKAGSELRDQISDQAGNIANQASGALDASACPRGNGQGGNPPCVPSATNPDPNCFKTNTLGSATSR